MSFSLNNKDALMKMSALIYRKLKKNKNKKI